jgi:UDP-N-acetylmuramate--alanine ligase
MIAIAPSGSIHFVGIGGAGMSALAETLALSGCRVTGSDRQRSAQTSRLESLGIAVQCGHGPRLVKQASMLVYSSAVKSDNPERIWASHHAIAEMRRAEFLGELTKSHFTLAVAGTHGKTTTSSLMGKILLDARKDPTIIVGGIPRYLGTNARVGSGPFMVVEADEFDRSFLALSPAAAIITNIEAEHLDCYRNAGEIETAFAAFANKVPFYGTVAACIDDHGVERILREISGSVVTYGTSRHAHYRAVGIEPHAASTRFAVTRGTKKLGEITLSIPGMHNVRNAMGAIALSTELGIGFASLRKSCREFNGVQRRFEILGKSNGIAVINDYAHHPSEISATLAAARGCGFRRIIAVFQPHLYTRTRDFAAGFARSLQAADTAIVTAIYGSREKAIPGVSAHSIVEKMKNGKASFVENKKDIAALLAGTVRKGDAVVFMGAGDITDVAVDYWKKVRQ